MSLSIKYFMLLVFLVFMYTVSLLIFTKGFLLKRVVVEHNSSCSVDFTLKSEYTGQKGCWMHGRFNKAIIILIDALRFDFMKYEQGLEKDVHYKNKLPIIRKLLSTKPSNAKLYKFIADPPTTTLQRLKGLTTGSLPTFVDAGSNFANTEIAEDNFIDQLVGSNKPVKFLGDDTWLSLYPGRFVRTFAFPSFLVKDLHTVDNGIIANLYTQLQKKDWDVTIAHFLGVDHCGHTFGPNHPAMAEKLQQMNQVISNVTSQMKDDTVLFLMGDHGMTKTGDHGGDSQDELETGLFVYSPSKIYSSTQPELETFSTVSQTDFVPTISLLMGVPIPFSNLGRVIVDLFTYCPWWKTNTLIKQKFHAMKALRLNAHQINLYLKAYQQVSSDFPVNTYYRLENLLNHAESDLQFMLTAIVREGETRDTLKRIQELENHYDTFISSVKEICQGIWAKFDLVSMCIGVMSVILTLLVNIYFVQISLWFKSEVPSTVIVVVLLCLVYIVYAAFQSFFVGETISSFMVFMLGSFNIVAMIAIILNFRPQIPKLISDLTVKDKKETSASVVLTVFAGIICCLRFLTYLSNSFIVYEDVINLFFLQSIAWIFCIRTVANNFSRWDLSLTDLKSKRHKLQQKSFDIMLVLTNPTVITFLITSLFSLCLRLLLNFRACREEQENCDVSLFLQPLTGLTGELEHYKNVRYFFSVGCLSVMVYFIRKLLQTFGNMNGNSPAVLCMRYIFPACAVTCSLYWALTALPHKILDSLPAWQLVILPRTFYILILVSMLIFVLKPLCIYLIDTKNKFTKDGVTIPDVYNKIKKDMNSEDNPLPLVYGLATSFTSSVLGFAAIVTMLLMLLLSDGLSPSVLLMTVCIYLSLEIYTAEKISSRTTDKGTSVHDMAAAAVFFSVMSDTFFYTTGHQATVTTVRWEAAFIGFQDIGSYTIPSILIFLNTFAAPVMIGVLSPLLIFWPYMRGTVAKNMVDVKVEKNSRGDFALFENDILLKKKLFQLFTMATFLRGLNVFGSVCAAAIHRRHLMVWKIFAPRFVFESVMCFTGFGTSLLMFLFVMRVHQALGSWAERLNK